METQRLLKKAQIDKQADWRRQERWEASTMYFAWRSRAERYRAKAAKYTRKAETATSFHACQTFAAKAAQCIIKARAIEDAARDQPTTPSRPRYSAS
jgi:hypothetical protein